MKTLIPLFLAVLALASAAKAGPIPTGPVHTNKLRFRIPFHSDADELRRLGATEIRLYVSRDRGRSWQQSQAVSPEAGKFAFQAPGDGEYWFIVRTLDAKKRLHPEGDNNEPGLQVIVDTSAPRLKLELKQPAPGRVQLSWNASDEHLDLSLLRLEYIQPGTLDWEPVSIEPRASGQTEWSIAKGGVVAVRGSASDFARNIAQDEVQHRVAGADQAVPRPQNPAHRQPVAGPGSASPFDDHALSMPEQFPGTSRTAARPPVEQAPSNRVASVPIVPLRSATNDAGGAQGSLVSQRKEEFPGGPRIQGAVRPPPPGEVSAEQRLIVKSNKFQIGYKLHDIAPAGVTAVELYITQDNGAKWYRFGIDEDRKSPVQVEVPTEGIYGFVLGIRTADGQSNEAPKDGDPPDLVVVVDQTPPRVELLPLRQGRGPNSDRIQIEWRYVDDLPAELPVALSYAASADGPWLKICDWTENTGNYEWKVDADLPPRFFVRIEARDQAGNSEVVQTPKALMLIRPRPTARILGVESAKGSGPR